MTLSMAIAICVTMVATSFISFWTMKVQVKAREKRGVTGNERFTLWYDYKKYSNK